MLFLIKFTYYAPGQKDHVLCGHSSVDGHGSYSHLLAVVTHAEVSTSRQLFT